MKDIYYEIYTRSSCPFCDMAINLLNEKSVEWVSIEDREEVLREQKERWNWRTVPIVVEMDPSENRRRLIGGYTELVKYFEKVSNH